MKHIVSIIAIILINIPAFSQSTANNMVAVFDDEKPLITHIDGTTVSEFMITYDSESNISHLKEVAKRHAPGISLEVEDTEEGSKKCKLVFNHKTVVEAVHKNLLFFQIKKVKYKGKVHTIDEFLEVAKKS